MYIIEGKNVLYTTIKKLIGVMYTNNMGLNNLNRSLNNTFE